MLLDYHTHTHLTDGVGEPVEYARVASERGLAEIACTDHAPLPDRKTDWTMEEADLPVYVGMVRQAQREFPSLPVRLGLEVDFIPGHEAWVRGLASSEQWDFFLGSVHFLGAFPVDRSAADWEGEDVEARWREYFALWAEAARSGLFDSLAHPDLPKKFGHRPATDFTAVYAEALRAVADAGVAIEVSTAGLHKPCREIYPAANFLRIAQQLNVPVTLGSDAHVPQDTGRDFAQAVALLRACGYTHICRFVARRRELVRL